MPVGTVRFVSSLPTFITTPTTPSDAVIDCVCEILFFGKDHPDSLTTIENMNMATQRNQKVNNLKNAAWILAMAAAALAKIREALDIALCFCFGTRPIKSTMNLICNLAFGLLLCTTNCPEL
jgi:hypothetical protein